MANNDLELFDDSEFADILGDIAVAPNKEEKKPDLTEQLESDIQVVNMKETHDTAVVEVAETFEAKKITKEDVESYDKHVAEFTEHKREELKDKVFSINGGMMTKDELKALKEKNKTDNKVEASEEIAVTPAETCDNKKSSKREKMKKEIQAVAEKHDGAVNQQKAEAEVIESQKEADKKAKEEAKAEKLAKMIYVDAQNTDDRKKLQEFMEEGRIVVDIKDRPFILAVQKTPIYNDYKPPIHKVYCDELVHVTVRRYYMDMTLMPPGSRTLITEVIWAYHKGYETFSVITKEQLDYLLDNNFITQKQIYYSNSDKETGLTIFGSNPNEPTVAQVEKEIEEYKRLHPKDRRFSSFISSEEIAEPVEEDNEIVLHGNGDNVELGDNEAVETTA